MTPPTSQIKSRFDSLSAQQWQDVESSIIEWRRHIHRHPELSFHEYKTTAFIRERLEEMGYCPHMFSSTGLYVDIGKVSDEQPKRLAIRADIDALPLTENTGLDFSSTVDGVAHACGHDGHTAIVLGVAYALSLLNSAADGGDDALPPVRLLFQPAEETVPGGAIIAIEEGCLSGVDRIMALHLDPGLEVGNLGTRTGPITSSNAKLNLTMKGAGGHSARPHLTQDPIHAMAAVIVGLNTALDRLLDARTATVLTWGKVEGGTVGNAIADSVAMQGTLRSASVTVWSEAEQKVRSIISSLVEPYGVEWDLNWVQGVPPVHNDRKANIAFNHAVACLDGGLEVVGTPQSAGGEDFAWYLRDVPGAMARLGVWDGASERHDLHQPEFVLDERSLILGTKLFVAAVLGRAKSGPEAD